MHRSGTRDPGPPDGWQPVTVDTSYGGSGLACRVYPSPFAGTAKSTCMGFEVGDLEKAVGGIAEVEGMKGAWFKDPGGNIISIGQPT